MGQRFFVTGASQGKTFGALEYQKLLREERHDELYRAAVLLEIDFEEKKVLRRLVIPREEMPYAIEGYATNFMVPTRRGGRLLVPSHALLHEIDLATFTQLGSESHRLHNDVHHVLEHEGRRYVVSTGIDHVLIFGGPKDCRAVPTIPDARPLDDEVDYRLMNTKPHLSHPNFVTVVDGEVWVTRAKQFDWTPLQDFSRAIRLSDVMVHDGIEEQGLYYFTSVKGQVIAADPRKGVVASVMDIVRDRYNQLAGWCRGLHVTKDHYYVGFSVLRRSKQTENLQWIKAQITRKAPPMPTRIEKIARDTGELVDQFEFGVEELSSIFWISPADTPETESRSAVP